MYCLTVSKYINTDVTPYYIFFFKWMVSLDRVKEINNINKFPKKCASLF